MKYNLEQVKAIRREIPLGQHYFPLCGEVEDGDPLASLLGPRDYDYTLSQADSYPVESFVKKCESGADKLPNHLEQLCLDPEYYLSDASENTSPEIYKSPGVWYFSDLIGSLHEYRQGSIDRAKSAIVQTEITTRIHDDLDFMLHTKSLIIIEGETRTGKTTSAENWCQLHPGQAVFIKLESGSDEKTFFRSIARALGTACSTHLKSAEIRIRIEDALQDGHLAVVFDEAHFLWPPTKRVFVAPKKIDWLRTALVDHGVPVALLSTPQFDKGCEFLDKRIGWNANQIKGRVKLHTRLPGSLSAGGPEGHCKTPHARGQ